MKVRCFTQYLDYKKYSLKLAVVIIRSIVMIIFAFYHKFHGNFLKVNENHVIFSCLAFFL